MYLNTGLLVGGGICAGIAAGSLVLFAAVSVLLWSRRRKTTTSVPTDLHSLAENGNYDGTKRHHQPFWNGCGVGSSPVVGVSFNMRGDGGGSNTMSSTLSRSSSADHLLLQQETPHRHHPSASSFMIVACSSGSSGSGAHPAGYGFVTSSLGSIPELSPSRDKGSEYSSLQQELNATDGSPDTLTNSKHFQSYDLKSLTLPKQSRRKKAVCVPNDVIAIALENRSSSFADRHHSCMAGNGNGKNDVLSPERIQELLASCTVEQKLDREMAAAIAYERVEESSVSFNLDADGGDYDDDDDDGNEDADGTGNVDGNLGISRPGKLKASSHLGGSRAGSSLRVIWKERSFV